MPRELTISLDEETFEALCRRAGPDNVSAFVEILVRDRVIPTHTEAELEAWYRAMAADEEAEREALERAEAFIGDSCP